MAMAPQGQAEHEHDHQHGQPNSSHTDPGRAATSVGDYVRLVAVILFALLTTLALALALKAAVRYLVGRSRRARRGRAGSGSGERDRDRDSNANISDPEKPAVEAPPPPPALVYSAASTKLAGAAAECTICLTEFADGDAVRVMPACRHGFHASCIERWLAGGRRSSCPTCRAPAAVATAAAATAQPDEATNRREPYSGAGDYARHVAFVILAALQMTAMALAMIDATVRYFLEGK